MLLFCLIAIMVLFSGCTQPTGQTDTNSNNTIQEPEITSEPSQKEKSCPTTCNDNNPCTTDACSQDTNYNCKYEAITLCCGNSSCEENETKCSCQQDCGNCSGNAGTCQEYYCSNNSCLTKTITNCCGNGTCESNENFFSCPHDCQQDCPNLGALPIEFEKKGAAYGDIDYALYVHKPSVSNFNGWIFDYEKHQSSDIGAAVFYCYNGKNKGENVKYHYCGQISALALFGGNKLVLTKTITDNDGKILETKEISPTLVYDIIDEKNFKYIETICEK